MELIYLKGRLDRLSQEISNTNVLNQLDFDEQMDMFLQVGIMQSYYDVLERRIQRAHSSNEAKGKKQKPNLKIVK